MKYHFHKKFPDVTKIQATPSSPFYKLLKIYSKPMYGGMRRHTQFSYQNLTGKDHFADLGVDGSILLKWILKNGVRGCGMDSSDSK
jgi:hypothetical protein